MVPRGLAEWVEDGASGLVEWVEDGGSGLAEWVEDGGLRGRGVGRGWWLWAR